MKTRVETRAYLVVMQGMEPWNRNVFDLAQAYANEQLKAPLDLMNAGTVFAVCRLEDEVPVEVLSIANLHNVIDCPMFRTKQSKFSTRATKILWQEMNSYLAHRGMSGSEILLHVDPSESAEQRCPQADQWLMKAGAKPANRLSVKIK